MSEREPTYEQNCPPEMQRRIAEADADFREALPTSSASPSEVQPHLDDLNTAGNTDAAEEHATIQALDEALAEMDNTRAESMQRALSSRVSRCIYGSQVMGGFSKHCSLLTCPIAAGTRYRSDLAASPAGYGGTPGRATGHTGARPARACLKDLFGYLQIPIASKGTSVYLRVVNAEGV